MHLVHFTENVHGMYTSRFSTTRTSLHQYQMIKAVTWSYFDEMQQYGIPTRSNQHRKYTLGHLLILQWALWAAAAGVVKEGANICSSEIDLFYNSWRSWYTKYWFLLLNEDERQAAKVEAGVWDYNEQHLSGCIRWRRRRSWAV